MRNNLQERQTLMRLADAIFQRVAQETDTVYYLPGGQKGFEIVESKQIADYREYKVWRLVGRRAL